MSCHSNQLHNNMQTPQPVQQPDQIHATVLLDRSGSMNSLREQVITGFNTFLAEQRSGTVDGAALAVSLVQFDGQSAFHVVIDAVPAAEVVDLEWNDYQPRGSTPLFDAIGRLIETLDQRVAEPAHLEEDQIICIITDGAENASTDFSAAEIKELIEARTEAGFAFIFLGANQDSFTAAETLGMQRGNTRNFAPSGPGARRVFEEVSGTVAQQRGRTPEERLFQKDELLAARIPEGEILGVEPLGQEPNGRPHR
jgi:uncharacterized protein YegL